MNPPIQSPRFFTARINPNGRIVIPAIVRDQMGLNPGEAVVMEIDSDGVLRLESHRAHIRRLQQEFSQPADADARPASRQLIEEREEEVTHQMEEWLG
jgi:AbrB family looped-hinge helix DNA binding protein